MFRSQPLPRTIRPMLARPGKPFDSPEHLFEIKWDGIRALVYVEQGGCRLISRHGQVLTAAFPEFACLARLPPGTLLDGELVVLRGGKPELTLVQRRHQLRSPLRIAAFAGSTPATFVAFDQLYARGEPLLKAPLCARRAELARTVDRLGQDGLIYSAGVEGRGVAFYRRVVAEGLEGVMAKRLSAPYQPGRRSGAWIKIKPRKV